MSALLNHAVSNGMKTLYFILILLLSGSSVFCQTDALQPQVVYSSHFVIDELPRTITYYTPLQYGKQDSYPLLILLHDDKSSAAGVIKKYGDFIHTKADSLGCVVMYPDAVAGHWNSRITNSLNDSINDAGFISIMLDYFVQQYHCDASRIYLIGIGNGGNMCYRFNCNSNSKPVAIATINASADINNPQDCRVKEPAPSINFSKETDIKSGIGKALHFLFAEHTKQGQQSG